VPKLDGSVDTSGFEWEEGATLDSVQDDLAALAAISGHVSVPEPPAPPPPPGAPDVNWP
jgi:hypothetical protein